MFDVLGMRFLFQAPPGLGFFECGGVRLMLNGPAAPRVFELSPPESERRRMPRRTTVMAEGLAAFVGTGLVFGLLYNTLFYPCTPGFAESRVDDAAAETFLPN